jgi:hypothetical protein
MKHTVVVKNYYQYGRKGFFVITIDASVPVISLFFLHGEYHLSCLY